MSPEKPVLPAFPPLFCYEANGNVEALLNTNGSLVATYQYDPYGNVLAPSGTLAAENLWRFSTK